MGSIFDYTSPIDAFMQQGNNALEQQGKISSNALERIRVLQAQMDYDNNNALRKAFMNSVGADGKPDFDKATTALIQFGKPDLAVNVMNARRAQDAYEQFGKMINGQQQQPAMTPDQTGAMNAVGQLSPQDKATLKADMVKNPQAPAQFVGATQDTPQFGIGLPLNQGAMNDGMSIPNQQQDNQGGLLKTLAPALQLMLGSGPNGMEKAGAALADAMKPQAVRENTGLVRYGADGKPILDFFNPGLDKGMTLDKNGAAQMVQNYLPYKALLDELKLNIANKNDAKLYPDRSGRQVPKTNQQLIDEANGKISTPEIQPPGMGQQVPGINQPSQPLNNNGYGMTPQEKKISEGRGENVVVDEKTINSEAASAQQKMVRNNKMLELLPKSELGPLSERITNFKSLLNEMGLAVPGKDPTDTQMLNKYSRQGAIEGAKQAFGPRISNLEVDNLIQSSPGRDLTEKANAALIKFDNIIQQRKMMKQSEYYKYINQGQDPSQFEPYFTQNFPLEGVSAPKEGKPGMPSTQQIVDELRKRGRIK